MSKNRKSFFIALSLFCAFFSTNPLAVANTRDTIFLQLQCPDNNFRVWLDSVQLDLSLNDTVYACQGPKSISLSIGDNDTSLALCASKEFFVFFQDTCGNKDTIPVFIESVDISGPDFILPNDVSLDCSTTDISPVITGFPGNFTDDCDPEISSRIAQYRDTISNESCPGTYSIQRTWILTDSCGNTTEKIQNIAISDTTPPSFTPPSDTTINSCDLLSLTSLPGAPSNLLDDCTPSDSILVSIWRIDTLDGGNTLLRIFEIADQCGNSTRYTQTILVKDTEPPILLTAAESVVILCDYSENIDSLFNAWINQHGNALATDNCTDSDSLSWIAYNTNSSNLASLPPVECRVGDAIRFQIVDFVVTDKNGNSITTTASFSLKDQTPPILEFCPSDTLLTLPNNECSAPFALAVPQLSDRCPGQIYTDLVSQELPITPIPNQTNAGVPVDSLKFNLTVPQNLLFHPEKPVVLTIQLSSVDADGFTEYFIIYDEEGDSLGITSNSPVECGNSTTSFSIPAIDFIRWTEDGNIDFTAKPNLNVPIVGGNLGGTINPTCPNSKATAILEYYTLEYLGLSLSYKLNNDPVKQLLNADSLFLMLPAGNHKLSFIGTDCAGNSDTCSSTIRVEDNQTPTIICPPSQTIITDPNLCTASFLPPLPLITDNCINAGDTLNYFEQFSFSGALNQNSVQGAPTTAFDFPIGQTTVVFVISDPSNNKDSCSFQINVVDGQPPSITCKNDTITINTLSSDTILLNSLDLIQEATDLCGTINLSFSDTFLTCFDAPVKTITVFATDQAGNKDSCISTIAVIQPLPQPTFTLEDCEQGTLRLFPNPPDGNFAFSWKGPNNFTSNSALPSITGANESLAGTYTLTLKGITGCEIMADLIISAKDLPASPVLEIPDTICSGTPITLKSGNPPSGESITYYWYMDDELLGFTIEDSLNISIPAGKATADFTLVIDKGNCRSKPSPIKNVTILASPIASILSEKQNYCPGEIIMLSAQDPGVNHTFQWLGPNGFSSSERQPSQFLATGPEQTGTYYLTVNNGFCDSPLDSVVLTIAPKPSKPVPGGPLETCEGNTITLYSNYPTASVYHWINPQGLAIATTADSLVLSNVDTSFSGAWRLWVTVGDCNSDTSEAINLMVNPLPKVTAAAAKFIVCEGESVALSAATSIPVATFQWTGPANFTSTQANPVISSFQSTKIGTYLVEVSTTKGCKSSGSVSLSMDVAPTIIKIEDNTPVCSSGNDTITLTPTFINETGLTFQWSGPMNYTAEVKNAQVTVSGTYQLRATNNNGCQTTDSIIINIPQVLTRPPTPIVASGNLCAGDKIILRSNITPADSQTYTWITPIGQLITNTPELEIPVLSSTQEGNYSIRINRNICSSPISDIFQLSVKPIPVITAGSNSPICEGSPILLFAEGPQGTQFRWEGPGFSATTPNPVLNNGSSGTYRLKGSLNGCEAKEDSIEIAFLPKPITPLILTSGPVCLDASSPQLLLQIADQTAVQGAKYFWYRGSALIDSTNTPQLLITDFSGITEGTTSFFAEAFQNGCSSARSAAAQVIFNTIPLTNALAGEDQEICSETILTMNATRPDLGTGLWSIVSGPDSGVIIANPSNPKTQISNLAQDTTYTFRWTLSNGVCTNYDFDEVKIKISSQAVVEAGDEILACASREIRLNATPVGFGTGRWTQGQVQQLLGVRINNPADPNTLITGLVPGNLYQFIWEVTSACGTNSDEVLVLISDPNPFAGFDFSICGEDGEVVLNAREPTSGSRGKWSSLNTNIQFVDPSKPTTSATGLDFGSNIFVWTIDEGICEENSRDTLVVTFTPIPIALDDRQTVPFGKEILLEILQNDSTFGFKPNLSVLQNPTNGKIQINGDTAILYTPDSRFIGFDTLVYEICIEDCECTTAEVILEVGSDAPCTIPTIFTPNGDGINDEFVIQCLLNDTAYPQSQLTIFNTWGDEVYRSGIPYKNDWDGNFRGVPLPPGTYYYILNFGNGLNPSAGFVVIQR